MCCFTHEALDPALGPAAADPRMRCQCGCNGVQCLRQADGEDLRCAVCRNGGVLAGPGRLAVSGYGNDEYEVTAWYEEAQRLSLPELAPGELARYVQEKYADAVQEAGLPPLQQLAERARAALDGMQVVPASVADVIRVSYAEPLRWPPSAG